MGMKNETLPGLEEKDFEKTKLSVKARSKSLRSLNPVEVAQNIEKARVGGSSEELIASALSLSKDMVRQLLRLLVLPSDLIHHVDWGRSCDGIIGFSGAVQLAHKELKNADRYELSDFMIKNSLTKDEVIAIRQLRTRSGDELRTCVERVLKRRSTPVVHTVLMGSVLSGTLHSVLESMTQLERNETFERSLNNTYGDIGYRSARLGVRRFTIIGTDKTFRILEKDSDFEHTINKSLEEILRNHN
jgi:hypothetical protein